MDRAELVDRLRVSLERRAEIRCAWLYGSRARGDARVGSDVDVAVLRAGEVPATLAGSAIALAGELEAEIGLPVDVIDARRAPVDLMHRVLRDGVLVLDRDPSLRIAFEVASRNDWFDLKPILDRYRAAPGSVRG